MGSAARAAPKADTANSFAARGVTSSAAPAATTLLALVTRVSDGLACFPAVQGSGIHHERHVTGDGPNRVKKPKFWAVNNTGL